MAHESSHTPRRTLATPVPGRSAHPARPRRWHRGALAALLTDIGAFVALAALGLGIDGAQGLAFLSAVAVGLGVSGAALIGPVDLLAWVALVAPVGFAIHAGVFTLGVESAGLAPALAIVPAALVGVAVLGGGLVLFGGVRGAPRIAGQRWVAWALFCVPALVLLRLVYAPLLELTPQEGYYWQFAQHLALGYLDHPPLAGWLIAASTALGHGEFWVRLPAILASIVTVLMAAAWARDVGGAAIGWRAAVLAAVLPYWFLAGFVMTPDAPLAAAWAAALFALHRALTRGSTLAWLAAGLAVGLGLLSKYTMVLLPLAVVVWLTLEGRWLHTLRQRGPWLAIAIALLVFSPVLVWNAQHDWVSFAYQGSRRLAPVSHQFELHWLLLGVLAVLTPWGVLALVRAARGEPEAPASSAAAPHGGPIGLDAAARRFCWVFTLVPLAPLAVASLWTESKFHWTGPLWVAALPLLAATLSAASAGPGAAAPARWQRWVAHGWAPVLGLLMAAYALPLMYVSAHGAAGVHAHPHYVETRWQALRLRVQAIEDAVTLETGARPAIIGLDRHDTANLMAFYDPRGDGPLDTAARHIVFNEPAHMYEFWFQPRDFAGRDLVLVACHREPIEDRRLAPQARRLGPVQVITLHWHGRPARECYARVLYGFMPASR